MFTEKSEKGQRHGKISFIDIFAVNFIGTRKHSILGSFLVDIFEGVPCRFNNCSQILGLLSFYYTHKPGEQTSVVILDRGVCGEQGLCLARHWSGENMKHGFIRVTQPVLFQPCVLLALPFSSLSNTSSASVSLPLAILFMLLPTQNWAHPRRFSHQPFRGTKRSVTNGTESEPAWPLKTSESGPAAGNRSSVRDMNSERWRIWILLVHEMETNISLCGVDVTRGVYVAGG